MIERKTIFSPDRVYRYTLWREFYGLFDDIEPGEACNQAFVQFIGLNPSTADETKDDPTIRRCIGFAKRWGYGALCMTNLFAFRATNPKVMRKQSSPVGQDNIHHLLQISSKAAMVVAAWGCNGDFLNQDLSVRDQLARVGVRLKCLRKTEKGHPEHPLYIPYETQLIDYS